MNNKILFTNYKKKQMNMIEKWKKPNEKAKLNIKKVNFLCYKCTK